MEIVAADIGGTHARFALAEVADGQVVSLGQTVIMKTADHASLQTAWESFACRIGISLPKAAAIAVACPVGDDVLQLTNNPWTIRPALIGTELGVDAFCLINDFGAVAHAVAHLDGGHVRHLCGPNIALPQEGVISIVGPGTGLGVALLLRRDGIYHALESEGGHIDFASVDRLEDAILVHLRERFRRVSAERLVSGPGLRNIYEALGAIEGRTIATVDDKVLWHSAFTGDDRLATAALDHFCLSLGSVTGDIALAHGADAVVIAGGLGLRLAKVLPGSGFASRFVAKGRFEQRMAALPVKMITHPEPGLFGVAAAFAKDYVK